MARLFCSTLLLITLALAIAMWSQDDGGSELMELVGPTPVNAQSTNFVAPLPYDGLQPRHLANTPHEEIVATRPLDWPGTPAGYGEREEPEDRSHLKRVAWQQPIAQSGAAQRPPTAYPATAYPATAYPATAKAEHASQVGGNGVVYPSTPYAPIPGTYPPQGHLPTQPPIYPQVPSTGPSVGPGQPPVTNPAVRYGRVTAVPGSDAIGAGQPPGGPRYAALPSDSPTSAPQSARRDEPFVAESSQAFPAGRYATRESLNPPPSAGYPYTAQPKEPHANGYPGGASPVVGRQSVPPPGAMLPSSAVTDPNFSLPPQDTAATQPASPERAADAPPPDAVEFEGTSIMARVGSEVILASEVIGFVNDILKTNNIPPEQADQYRDQLSKQRLDMLVDTKLILMDLKKTVPAENLKRLEETVAEEFEKNELKNRLQKTKLETRAQLDSYYRDLGTSLEREKRAFVERILAEQWIRQQVTREEEVTHAEMLSYYRQNLEDYKVDARCRWEQLSIRFGRSRTKEEAYAQLAHLGNQLLQGASFEQLASQYSEGPTADEGGQYDWTTQGSLVSDVLDKALFALPVGQLSPILEDRNEFHIIRVHERTPAGYTPFLEAQVEIKNKIRDERFRQQSQAYLAKVRQSATVTTIYDDDEEEEQLSSRERPSRY